MKLHFLTALGAIVVSTQVVRAEVKMHSLFSDNMILQRQKPAPIWGTAAAGERVVVQIAGQEKTAVADARGKWMVRLEPMEAATGLTLRVVGENSLDFENVVVGDVFICAGQSNMEFSLRTWSPPESEIARNAAAEIAKANYPNIRLLMVPNATNAKPQTNFIGTTRWNVCTPESAAGFSAVGYYFGRELHQKLGVPIGLIDSTWGDTIAEAWTSRETLGSMPLYQGAVRALDASATDKRPLSERMAEWWKQNDSGSNSLLWAQENFTDTSWKTMALPTNWENAGLPDFNGVVWFRKEVNVPAAWVGKDLNLHLGNIDDQDTTFWNGVQVGSMNVWNQARNHKIPGVQVKAGRNVIAVRVLDTGGGGGLFGGDKLRLALSENETISLENSWKYNVSKPLSEMTPVPIEFNNNPNVATVLYNGMIAPLVPYAIKGAIWYQGESNTGQPVQYRTLFPALIRDWRARFGQDFGFYFVQLANFLPRNSQPEESNWAELREAQTLTLQVPKTGMATTIDIGEADDIHPRNKWDVGKRLALAALAKEYNQPVEYSGPFFQSATAKNGQIRVRFSHAEGLKTSDGAAPVGFAIAGEDKKWVWANAQIEGESVVLSNPAVKNPVYVRYAWAHNPATNLCNAAGLPAVPFRTDGPLAKPLEAKQLSQTQ